METIGSRQLLTLRISIEHRCCLHVGGGEPCRHATRCSCNRDAGILKLKLPSYHKGKGKAPNRWV